MAVNVGLQPALDLAQIAQGDVLPQVGQFLFHAQQHLRAVGAAKGVGGEIADAAAGPVGILQAALGIIGDVNAQILLVEPVPGSGDVPVPPACRQSAASPIRSAP